MSKLTAPTNKSVRISSHAQQLSRRDCAVAYVKVRNVRLFLEAKDVSSSHLQLYAVPQTVEMLLERQSTWCGGLAVTCGSYLRQRLNLVFLVCLHPDALPCECQGCASSDRCLVLLKSNFDVVRSHAVREVALLSEKTKTEFHAFITCKVIAISLCYHQLSSFFLVIRCQCCYM